MLAKIEQTLKHLTPFANGAKIGIILGTGLGALVKELDIEHSLPYGDIPNFPVSTVESHQGRLLIGKLGGVPVLVMQGRFHYYEGYSMQEVTFPVRVMKQMGVQNLFISNASGGLNPNFEVSDLMLMNDHINLLPEHPLRGKNLDTLGPRFPDMSEAYDEGLLNLAKEIGNELGIKLQEGVYAAVQGPTLETKAEYTYLRIIGADAVGMSTVPENIVAIHMGMKVFAISVITDLGVPGLVKKISLQDVLNAASIAEPKMTRLISEMVKRI
ncbi:MAG: purine-nucleoside phosphorylase [Bacteroidetes bacterium B1(2017)]|nr:MAG: purine-nucleoside phosphorylase [Bacteroidetes bacterium B1(2017)]